MADQELVLRIRGDLRDIQTKLNRLEREGRSTADTIGDRFARAGRRMKSAFQAARGPLLAIGAATGGLAVLAQRSLAATEALQDMADRADVSAEFLQEMRIAASQSGASTRDFDDAISRMNRRLGLFIQSGGGPAAEAFERLGIETRIASGELRDSESVFNAAVAALEGVESAAERSAIASQLFGEDSGPRLATLLARGTEGLAEFRADLRETGEIMSDQTVRDAAAASDALERVQQRFSADVNQSIAEQADDFVALGDALGALGRLAVGVAASLGGIADELQNIFRRGREVASLALPQLQDEAQTLREDILLQGDNPFGDGPGPNASQRSRELFRRLQRVQARIERLEALGAGGENTRRDPATTDRNGGGDRISIPNVFGGEEVARVRATQRRQPISFDLPFRREQEPIEVEAFQRMKAEAEEVGGKIAKSAGQNIAPEFQRHQDSISNALQNGMRAAFNGDLLDFIKNNLRNAAFSALADAITSAFASKGGNLFSAVIGAAFGGSVGTPGKATGGPASGMTLVGEQGPELVNLGAMANVMTANMTRMAMAGAQTQSAQVTNVTQRFHLHAEGAVMTSDLIAQMNVKAQAAEESAVARSAQGLAKLRQRQAKGLR